MPDTSKLRRGIYKVRGIPPIENWAQVEDVNGGASMPLDESLYRERGYEPSFDQLPWLEDYKKSGSRGG